MKANNKNKKKKRKDGIWFGSAATVDAFASEKAEKIALLIEDIIFYGITVPIQLLQTAGVVLIAYFNNAFPELAFFVIGFFFTRTMLGETFHLNSTIACTTVTWTFFYLVTSFIPSIYISVFLCLLLGTFAAIYLNYIVVKDSEKCQKD